jgi:hypothetical protein
MHKLQNSDPKPQFRSRHHGYAIKRSPERIVVPVFVVIVVVKFGDGHGQGGPKNFVLKWAPPLASFFHPSANGFVRGI